MTDSKGTVIVTGANGGLGSAIISQIISSPQLSAKHHGVYTVRNVSTAHALDAALATSSSTKQATTHSHEKISLDLLRLSTVREAAANINKRVATGEIPRIHAVILNAGYEEFEKQTWTDDGLDTTFAANYLGHWLLTSSCISSHNPHNPWNGAFKDARYNTIFAPESIDSIATGRWSSTEGDKTGWAAGYRRYGASKLCGVTTISELQRRLNQDSVFNNISVLGIDPGLVNTGIVRQSGWVMRVLLWQLLLSAITVVSGDIIAAALKSGPPPLSARPKGLYLNVSELGVRNPEANDPAKGAMLWKRYTVLFATGRWRDIHDIFIAHDEERSLCRC
ncbi:NAD(P)-binding protein [Ophiobolus disseminans]|uniref:NAD(P)-binding protein n=1 Tax=Ophiobolus disseminans TaxID=1469910 RepID=A0A6A7A9D1_9PLEO|nr:NAD(P)-binding protein [Ophiobolus disseminans]